MPDVIQQHAAHGSSSEQPLPQREPGVTYPGDSRYRRPGARPQPTPVGGAQ
jgi:hypothetical protein